MKKFLGVLLIIATIFLFTACGSEEDGTKGAYEGNGYTVTWEKAALSNTITLKIQEDGSMNYFTNEFNFAEDLLNYQTDAEGNAIIPFEMTKEFKKGVMTYTIKPIKQYVTEEGVFSEVQITEYNGQEQVDPLLAFKLIINCSKETPLSILVDYVALDTLYSGATIYGDGDYSAGYARIENGIEVAINNPYGDTWIVTKNNKELFDIGDIDLQNGKTIIPVIAKKEGKDNVYIQNVQRGLNYALYIGSSGYTDANGNIMGYNVMLFSINAIKEETKASDLPVYKEIKKQAKKKGFDFEKIIIPEGMNISAIDGIGLGASDETETTRTETYVDKNGKTQTRTIVEPVIDSMSREEFLEMRREMDRDAKKYEDAFKQDSTGKYVCIDPSVFPDDQARKEYEESLNDFAKYAEVDDRVSADSINYAMLEFKTVDGNNNKKSYVVAKKEDTSVDELVKSFEGYKAKSSTYKVIPNTNINGINATLILTDFLGAAVFEAGDYIYVYESLGTGYTEQSAKAELAQYINPSNTLE